MGACGFVCRNDAKRQGNLENPVFVLRKAGGRVSGRLGQFSVSFSFLSLRLALSFFRRRISSSRMYSKESIGKERSSALKSIRSLVGRADVASCFVPSQPQRERQRGRERERERLRKNLRNNDETKQNNKYKSCVSRSRKDRPE